MTPPTFRIGDEVIITGQPCGLSGFCIGGKGTVKDINSAGNYYVNVWWYPASSLRLVEELKIGDWVAVLNDGCGKKTGDVFCIDRIMKERIPGDPGPYYSAEKWPLYSMSELRKLTPEEIKQHMKPIKVVPTTEDNTKRLDTHREEIDAVNERLSTIEHRQDEIEKRIDFIEAFQKDEKHEAYTTYTYKPGEEGIITVHCLCGRKHVIEATPRRTRS